MWYLVIVILGFIYLFPVVGFIGDLIEGKKRKQKKKNDLNNWLKNEEPIHRDLTTYPEDWGMRRQYIAEINEYSCQKCRRKGFLGFHVHHILPLSKGGTNSLENLAYLCQRCHENEHPHMINARNERYKKRREIAEKAHWKRYWARKKS